MIINGKSVLNKAILPHLDNFQKLLTIHKNRDIISKYEKIGVWLSLGTFATAALWRIKGAKRSGSDLPIDELSAKAMAEA